jgi:quercetin dioxygenase-like cupin family protein
MIRRMPDTPKPTIVSRARNLGEFAITSWGEMACIRALRLDPDNNFCILDYRAPAGFGPPRHLHYVQDEVFEILEGTIAVWSPDCCGVLHPGDIVSLPSGIPHAWRSIDDRPVHLTVIVTPGGPGGFKEFFPTIQQQNLTVADIPELIAAAEIGGMQVTGPPLTDEEVERLKAGEQLTAEPTASAG